MSISLSKVFQSGVEPIRIYVKTFEASLKCCSLVRFCNCTSARKLFGNALIIRTPFNTHEHICSGSRIGPMELLRWKFRTIFTCCGNGVVISAYFHRCLSNLSSVLFSWFNSEDDVLCIALFAVQSEKEQIDLVCADYVIHILNIIIRIQFIFCGAYFCIPFVLL